MLTKKAMMSLLTKKKKKKKKDLIVVPIEWEKKEYHFPIHKREDHTTFVACIAADGSYFRPLIVVKRKTIEARVLRLAITI